MPETLVIIITLLLFVVAMGLGFYIHTVLFSAGMVGIILLYGPEMLVLLGSQPYMRTASYSLSTVPMFVLMAQFALHSGMVDDLFYIVNGVAKGRARATSSLTLVAGAMLGAVAGSGSAASAAIGQVAVPEMRRVGIDRNLAGAICASAGSLSAIVPPSIILILYGVATETSIGDIFIGAVIPSILTVGVFIALVGFLLPRGRGNVLSGVARNGQAVAERPKNRVVVSLLAIGVIVAVIFGGIYTGVLTPTETGAIGAGMAFVAALLIGKVSWSFLAKSLGETLKVSVMVMLIMIAAQVFGRFVALSGIPRLVIEGLAPLVDSPLLLLALLGVIYFVLFMFIEGAAVIVMTVPVLAPLLAVADIDMVWFGVFVGLLCTLGLITPPVGLSVYAVAGATGMPPGGVFRSSALFALVAAVIAGGLLVIFPQLVLWLPNRG